MAVVLVAVVMLLLVAPCRHLLASMVVMHVLVVGVAPYSSPGVVNATADCASTAVLLPSAEPCTGLVALVVTLMVGFILSCGLSGGMFPC